MAETSKHDVLLSDLSIVESQISILLNQVTDLIKNKSDLQAKVETLQKENSALSHKLKILEKQAEDFPSLSEENLFDSMNSSEKETLKVKIRELISRIDYHLSS